jgi:ribosomal protein L40E
MGLFESFGEKQAVKLIQNYTGQVVIPKFIATCDASISPDWRGVVVFDNHSLWLVNRLGARGVEISNIVPDPNNGQYPSGTRGYPKYHFTFYFTNGQGSFSIYPITQDSGQKLQEYLRRYEDDSDTVEKESQISVKVCDKCGIRTSLEETNCKSCGGSSFSHKQMTLDEVEKITSKDSKLPEFKICPMCAEEIRYAAKKCRYCQHLMDVAE